MKKTLQIFMLSTCLLGITPIEAAEKDNLESLANSNVPVYAQIPPWQLHDIMEMHTEMNLWLAERTDKPVDQRLDAAKKLLERGNQEQKEKAQEIILSLTNTPDVDM